MDENNEIVKPLIHTLYRQSSLETRLSPIHSSGEESSDSEDNYSISQPKIVHCTMKEDVQSIIKEEDRKQCKGVLEEIKLKKKMNKPFICASSMIEESSNSLKEKQSRFLDNKPNNISENNEPSHRTAHIREEKFKRNLLVDLINHIPQTESETESSVGIMKAIALKYKKEELNCEEEERVVGIDRVDITLQNQNKNKLIEEQQMATLRPKSPSSRPIPIKGEKDESIWDKLGTLGRKKRIKEVQEVQAEGKYAIDSPGCPTAPVIPPEEYNLDDNEERCMLDPKAYEDQRFLELLNVLKEWVNDELASQRIIVQNLSEDLYDGQVLQKLLEKLTGDKLDVPEVTQSEEGQKQKLAVVLNHFNQVLGVQRITHNKWNVEAIHSKNIVTITHLLVALARHFRPPVRLPEHVSVYVVIVQKVNGQLHHKTVRESLTKAYDDVGMRCERDAFDTLIDHAPEKLLVVKKSLVTFVNKHLNKMNFEVTEIESQFHDGVYLIMLMGLLEGFFVPHYIFHLTPHEFDQKVHNVNFAFELMEEVGLQRPKARPEDVVNMDLKSTLRVLYSLFLRYRTIQ